MNRERIYAAAATLVLIILLGVWVSVSDISVSPAGDAPWPPRDSSEIALLEPEEFIDPYIEEPEPADAAGHPMAADLAEPADARATAAPSAGSDVKDAGAAGDPVPPASTDRKAPVTTTRPKADAKSGPAKSDAADRRRAERAAGDMVNRAFKNSKGKNNTDNASSRAPGDAGKPSSSPAGNYNGRASGYAGGGWALPSFRRVPSTSTGRVELMVKIDRSGRVTSVTVQGGVAPAGTDPAVQSACVAEVRSRRFTRNDPENAPDESTAYITYTFR